MARLKKVKAPPEPETFRNQNNVLMTYAQVREAMKGQR